MNKVSLEKETIEKELETEEEVKITVDEMNDIEITDKKEESVIEKEEILSEKVDNIVESKITNNEDTRTEASLETVNLSKSDSASFLNLSKENINKQNVENEQKIKENITAEESKTTYEKISDKLNSLDKTISELDSKLSDTVTSASDKLSETTEKVNQALYNMDETISNKTDKWFNGQTNNNQNNSFQNNNNNQANNRQNKNDSSLTLVAVLLNVFLPGLGQLILGQVSKGVTIIVVDVIGILLVTLCTCGILTVPFQIVVTILACMDSYNCGNIISKGGHVEPMEFHITK